MPHSTPGPRQVVGARRCVRRRRAFRAGVLVACLLLVGWSGPDGGWVWWVCLVLAAVVLLAMAVNRWVLPAVIRVDAWAGRSFGIKVVDRDGADPGPWRLLGRDVAHLLDTLPLLLGWLWPLIDGRGRTFADLIARTEVPGSAVTSLPDRAPAGRHRGGRATALATVVAALGYFAGLSCSSGGRPGPRADRRTTGPRSGVGHAELHRCRTWRRTSPRTGPW